MRCYCWLEQHWKKLDLVHVRLSYPPVNIFEWRTTDARESATAESSRCCARGCKMQVLGSVSTSGMSAKRISCCGKKGHVVLWFCFGHS